MGIGAPLVHKENRASGYVTSVGFPHKPHGYRVRYFLAGFLTGLLLLSVGLGRASAYSQARHVVYAVFPRQTEAAALRVVGCETGHAYNANAFNRNSSATGLFQVLQGNSGRVLWYGHQWLRIRGWRLWNPWYNARVALFLSHGGWDWSEWSCQP